MGVGEWRSTSATTCNTANTYKITYDFGGLSGGGYAVPVAPKPETNLDWLDRRVNEMRVKL